MTTYLDQWAQRPGVRRVHVRRDSEGRWFWYHRRCSKAGTDRPRDRRRIRVIGETGRGTMALLFAAAWPLVLVTWAWIRLTEDRDDDDPQGRVPPQYR